MSDNAAYDLLILLDSDLPEERSTQILDAVKKQIDSGGGTLKGDVDWGVRKLAYEIDHRPEALYHLFQFEGSPDLLSQLNHSLTIEDAILRHRIIRLPRGAPDQPPKPATPTGREPESPSAGETDESSPE